MEFSLLTILKLYGPLILFLVFAIFIFLTKQTSKGSYITFRPTIAWIDWFEVKIPIDKVWLMRILLIIIAILPLTIYLVIDYSSLFPQHLKMEVFYDPEGIENSLKQFSNDELNILNVDTNYLEMREKYYSDLDKTIESLLNIEKCFDDKNGVIHSIGETSFFVERIEGIQKYHITESKGELLHTFETPNHPSLQFRTYFDKLNTKEDYINISLFDIILQKNIIIKPQFKQILAKNTINEGIAFNHTVVGITRIKILPYPSYSNTLYFAILNKNKLIPIAYAIYR